MELFAPGAHDRHAGTFLLGLFGRRQPLHFFQRANQFKSNHASMPIVHV
jgi:hypothetical protein